jgi:hypothetical protein
MPCHQVMFVAAIDDVAENVMAIAAMENFLIIVSSSTAPVG